MGWQNFLLGMDAENYRNYKERNIKHIYNSAINDWIRPLFPSKILDLVEKKNLQKLYHGWHWARLAITRKPAIPTSLEYMATTHCNMACEECNTKIPYFSREGHIKTPDFASFKGDIDKLLGSVDFIYALGFVGGEPLLNRDLARMVEYACSKRQIHHVFIATNCTIPLTPALIKAMKHKKFAIQLSDYTMVDLQWGGVKSLYPEYKKTLMENGINVSLLHERQSPENPIFLKMPELFPDRQDEAKMKKVFGRCFGQFCNMLCDGVLLQCTISVYIWRNMERSRELVQEMVNIRELDQKELTKKIIEFYSRPFSEACHYCHWSEQKEFAPRARQLEDKN